MYNAMWSVGKPTIEHMWRCLQIDYDMQFACKSYRENAIVMTNIKECKQTVTSGPWQTTSGNYLLYY